MDTTRYIKKQNQELTIIFIAIFGVAFQLIFTGHFGFHRDELLYFSLSRHLDFGYHSVPPFIGFMAYLSVKLFGYNLFAAKFFPALAEGVLIVVTAMIAKEFKGGFYARILTATGVLSTLLFVRAFGLFQPVPFDILFWTLSIYFFTKYVNTSKPKHLIFLGITIGVGFLNKYNMLFLVPALFIVVLCTKHRKVLASKYLYVAALVAIIIAMPNIVWQIAHDFPVVQHFNELQETQLVNMSPFTFLTEQLLMVLPATIIIIPGLVFFLFSKHTKQYRMFGWIAVIVLIEYLLLKGKSYYTAGIYPMLIAAGQFFLKKSLKTSILEQPLYASFWSWVTSFCLWGNLYIAHKNWYHILINWKRLLVMMR